jgi:hypothetical protein
MSKDKLREDVEAIRMKLSNRIDLLTKHEQEYQDNGEPFEAERCDLRARQLYMVLNDIDKALK